MSVCIKCKLKENVPPFTASCGCSFCAKCIADDYNLHVETLCQEHGSINKEHNLDAAGDGHHCRKKSIKDDYHEDCACALNEYPCKFYDLGCSFKGSPLLLDKHQNDVPVHMDLIACQGCACAGNVYPCKCYHFKGSPMEVDKHQTDVEAHLGLSVTKQQTDSSKVQLEEFKGTFEKQCSEMEKRLIEKLNNKLDSYKEKDTEELNKQKQLLEKYNEDLSKQKCLLEKDTEELNKQKQLLEKYDNDLNKKKCLMEKVNEELNRQKQLLEKYNDDLKKQKCLLEKHKEEFTTGFSNVKKLEMKLGKIEFPHAKHSYTYIWKVEKFSQLQRQHSVASKVTSPPFYTAPNGYQMRLELYPNGCDSTQYYCDKGTHLGLFLNVMKGDWDGILKWPIKYTATFTLLAQYNRSEHKSFPINSDDYRGEDPFARPNTESNLGLGTPKFFLIDDLKTLYLVDDCLYVKLDINVN